MEWYDKEEDILNIELNDSGEYWKSVEFPKGIVFDIDKEGKIKGIEVMQASKVFSGDVKKVIDTAISENKK
jgi:uncharacterized protein YuzE